MTNLPTYIPDCRDDELIVSIIDTYQEEEGE